jgi:hypothetical protein
VHWKPIVWGNAEHYPQWLGYPARETTLPVQGSRVTLSEHPERTFVAMTVEAGTDPAIVSLKPLRPLDSY